MGVRNQAYAKYPENKFVYIFAISREKNGRRSWFCYLQINAKLLCKLILSYHFRCVWHSQITQNNKFAISLQYIKNEVSDEVDFLHADKPFKLILWFLIGIVKHSRNPQSSKFSMSLQYLKKEIKDEVDFFHTDKHQSFLQVKHFTVKLFNKNMMNKNLHI